MFQFTLPRGERPEKGSIARPHGGFNSRSRGGSDWIVSEVRAVQACFNSRSRGGSDRRARPVPWSLPGFQFTLPRGERRG